MYIPKIEVLKPGILINMQILRSVCNKTKLCLSLNHILTIAHWYCNNNNIVSVGNSVKNDAKAFNLKVHLTKTNRTLMFQVKVLQNFK